MIDYPIPVLGFSAYSGTGKTTLLKQLLPLLSERGLRIGMIKHTHHSFDIDYPGKDSYELRHAGASKMLVISRRRMAYMQEFPQDQAEPELEQALQALDPSLLDIVLVEGFKHARCPKIELFRPEVGKPLMFTHDSNIIAIATNVEANELPTSTSVNIPLLDLDQPGSMVDFIIAYLQQYNSGVTAGAGSKHVIPRQPSCADDEQPDMFTVREARQKILDEITPLTASERLPLRQALNRVLAEDIVSSLNVPGHTNSAVDGYALAGNALPDSGTRDFRISGTAMAGIPFDGSCGEGECIRIMTGAVMPAGTDSVIMQEHVRLDDDTITIDSTHRAGQNVRQAGEDIAVGDTVLQRHKAITAADLGIISSLGIGEIEVFRRPRVAFFSTGDELRSIGDGSNRSLQSGEIYDSNRYSLYGMLKRLNVEILDLGVVRDNPDDMKLAFDHACSMADIIITSGGVSVGEADYIKDVLTQLGSMHFWKIAMKPGRPLTFGHINNSLFFGLPGNPVAVMVTFYQFVKPAIHYLGSGTHHTPLTVNATCASSLRKKPGRFEFIRGIYTSNSDGTITVHKFGHQGSGILTSMSQANCFILLDEDNAGVSAGDTVRIQPFDVVI
jgi:molybdopterin molybdotransferase